MHGGTINMNFELKAAHRFATYNGDADYVGSISFSVPVSSGDTQDTVIQKITESLNHSTIIDIKSTNTSAQAGYINPAAVGGSFIQVPVYGTETLYGGFKNIHIQAGAEAGQYIDIEYESLNNWILGIEDTNTLTVEDAGNAINEAKAALQKVSEQRSLFGAYQNRLEHAYNVNKNTEENTQASESLIRDTDIADTMMEFSINNILMQAGVSMLTQANQQGQIAMRLLQ